MGKLLESSTYSDIGNTAIGRATGAVVTPAPPPIPMPVADSEEVRRARLRAMRRTVAQNQGRESTILGGAGTTLGGA